METNDLPVKRDMTRKAVRQVIGTCLGCANQGLAYGKHRYQGPKQPPFIRKAHRYRFRVYGLDRALELPTTSRKTELMQAMSGHILQAGEAIGWYQL